MSNKKTSTDLLSVKNTVTNFVSGLGSLVVCLKKHYLQNAFSGHTAEKAFFIKDRV